MKPYKTCKPRKYKVYYDDDYGSYNNSYDDYSNNSYDDYSSYNMSHDDHSSYDDYNNDTMAETSSRASATRPSIAAQSVTTPNVTQVRPFGICVCPTSSGSPFDGREPLVAEPVEFFNESDTGDSDSNSADASLLATIMKWISGNSQSMDRRHLRGAHD
jgi:hypothetical protein